MKIEINGRSRVIVENVQPQVDGGRYPAKRVVGERVHVTAEIFGDGHDHIRAEILFRKRGELSWQTVEMTAVGNDAWKASFVVTERLTYMFTVQAWIDHFETWYDGFKKKAAAKIDVKVELLEGGALLRKLADGKNKELLRLAEKLENGNAYAENVKLVLSEEFAEIVHQNPLREFETRYDEELFVEVEFQKALFSSWYELFPRSASLEGKHGTFQDVIRLLPRIS
ncbi:MAG TPA: maltotransferase domain-containing protein, partial [Cyclobacteriaceae bacterium]